MFVSEAYDRYFRAELLQRLARNDEHSLVRLVAERAAYELVYLAPSHRRRQKFTFWRTAGFGAVHYRRSSSSGAGRSECSPRREARSRLAG